MSVTHSGETHENNSFTNAGEKHVVEKEGNRHNDQHLMIMTRLEKIE